MKGKQDRKDIEKWESTGELHKIRAPEFDAHYVLSQREDFLFERTALEKLLEDGGDILLPSVVCTPETAGMGIENGFGKIKFEQRRDNLDTVIGGGKVFIDKIKALCVNPLHLPMCRIWKFSRRTRDYIRVYMDMKTKGTAPGSLSHKDIEDLRKRKKSHRNMSEIDAQFIKNA